MLERLLEQNCSGGGGSCSAGVCQPTQITAPITISSPGYYCLANGISGTITIASDNVVLNLNGHTINGEGGVGIAVEAGSARVIFNGIITNASSGIRINNVDSLTLSGVTILNGQVGIQLTGISENISIENFKISNMDAEGIDGSTADLNTIFIHSGIVDNTEAEGMSLNFVIGLDMQDVTISSVDGLGGAFFVAGLADGCTFRNVNAYSPGTGGFNFVSVINTVFYECNVFDCFSFAQGVGFFAQSASSTRFVNCSVMRVVTGIEEPGNLAEERKLNSRGPAQCSGFYLAGGDSNQFANCVASNIIAVNDNSYGFFIENCTNSYLQDCVAELIAGGIGITSAAYSFINSTTGRLVNCQAFNTFDFPGFLIDAPSHSLVLDACLANDTQAEGFLIDGYGNSFSNCQAIGCLDGYVITGTGNILNYCQSNHNGNNGFSNEASTVLGNCSAIGNVLNGFLNGNLYHCFATNNGTDYSGITGATDDVTDTTFAAGTNLFFP